MPETVQSCELLQQRLHAVWQRVRTAEHRFGRIPGSVRILPVSKTRPAADIACLAQAEIDAIGESYLQEAQDKLTALAGLGLQWHFIGPLQSNKTRPIAEQFQWVHSVAREKIARRLNAQRPAGLPPLNVCLQVNVCGEAAKSGVAPAALTELALCVTALPHLRLRGLMTIPTRYPDFTRQRTAFGQLRVAFETLRAQGFETLDTLSMGMSADLEAAIAEGATVVRVGTDIFGTRAAKVE
jgi:pyridoxal phosphate enzyme (YggS family)